MTIIKNVFICDTFMSEDTRQHNNVLRNNIFFLFFSNQMSECIIVICILKHFFFVIFKTLSNAKKKNKNCIFDKLKNNHPKLN